MAFYILSQQNLSGTLVQDAEQVVKVIAVILFLGGGSGLGGHGSIHAGAEGLGEDGVGHNRVDLLLGRLRRADRSVGLLDRLLRSGLGGSGALGK